MISFYLYQDIKAATITTVTIKVLVIALKYFDHFRRLPKVRCWAAAYFSLLFPCFSQFGSSEVI